MLYSIIPPVLVILSLLGIIVLLAKKSGNVAGLSEKSGKIGEVLPDGSFSEEDQNSFGKKLILEKLKHGTLVVLEKTTRRFRVMFLKLENVFTSWGNSLREKRKRKKEEMEKMNGSEQEENLNQEDVLERVNSYQKKEDFFERRGAASEPVQAVRPMISEKVSEPENKIVRTKNHLEKILIERIAANPKDTEAYERLGEYYFEIGNWEHSKECYKQVMKLTPRNIGVRSRMRKLERMLGG